MVYTTLTSELRFGSRTNNKRSTRYSNNIYQVVVNDFDGETAEYEIMADSIAEASSIAEQRAAEDHIDINYIEVYVQR